MPKCVPGKNCKTPDSMWNKNAHNHAALEQGIPEVQCDYKRQKREVENGMERRERKETEAETERQMRRGKK